jgi:alpha-glucoside transport system permease protein
MLKVVTAVLAIVGGVAGAVVLFYILDRLADRLPGPWEGRVKPYVFIGPAVAVIGLFLIYPAVRTLILSFANDDSTRWVGFQNYVDLLTSKEFLTVTLLNTLLWIALVPASVVVIGLAVAVLADRLGPRGEKVTKSLIFLPMAVSFVAAGTIWIFVYAARPEGQPQVGILNAVWVAFGGSPVPWLQYDTARLNSLLLMVILVWMQAGFAMVLLSAAVKSVPDDTLEAARMDGANERQVFFRVVVPQIWPTVITVFITVLITVMKIFDIVYVMTGGNFRTDVIALRFFTELFAAGNNGLAAAVVVILMIMVTPILIYQVRHFRAQELQR